MRFESRLAVLAHAANDDELRDVAANLCAAAALLIAGGHLGVGGRIVDQAVAVVELRRDVVRSRGGRACEQLADG
jgi:hypothetical protein